MPPALPTGTVAFLFTDIQGSTQLWQKYPAAMPKALAQHHALLTQAIEANNGYIFQIIGDAFCAAFFTVKDSLQAAQSAQLLFQNATWERTEPIRVRMAIHAGAVEVRPGETTSGEYVSGITLSRSARLLSAGHGSQILLSLSAAELVRDHLPVGISLIDLGSHRLKDLIHPERIFQAAAADLPSNFPPLKTLDLHPHNLPVQLTNFVGRKNELAELTHLLSEPAQRMLTLIGTGGTGKTRLTLQLAADCIDSFPDGAWFVDLAAITDPGLVIQTVSKTWDLRDQPGYPLIDSLKDFLRHKHLLLILDNCEHLLEACARLSYDLLQVAPQLFLLATSREPLGVPGEILYRLAALSTPDPLQLPPLESLSTYDSVRLFIDRVQLAQPAFCLTNTNAPAVAQICARLDGIPLAIELAAARVRSFSPDQVSARLEDRFRLLTGGSRTSLPRQQTLQAAIDWSHALLTQPERLLFRRLAVFQGGWDFEAAESVCSGNGLDIADLLELLPRLVDRSLVVADELPSGMRYRMLDTIRLYSRQKLIEASEREIYQTRHLEWLIALGKSFGTSWWRYGGEGWMSRIDLEQDNLRAALSWGLAQPASLEPAFELAGLFFDYWYFRSHWVEGRQWAEKLLQAGEMQTISPGRLGTVLWVAAAMTFFQGELEAAKVYTRASQEACQKAGDRLGLAINLHHAGAIALTEGKFEQAELFLNEGLKRTQEMGNEKWEISLYIDLGTLAYYRKDLQRAYGLYLKALDILQRNGDYTHYALTNLAEVCLEMGKFEQAQSYVEQARAVNQQIHEPRVEGFIQDLQARLLSRQERYDQARLLWLDSLRVYWNIRERDAAIGLMERLAENANALGNLSEAVRLLSSSQSARNQFGLFNPHPEKMQRLQVNLCAQMSETAFNQAWAEGQSMNLEASVEQILDR